MGDLLKWVSIEVPEGKKLTCVHGGKTLTDKSVLSHSNVADGATLTAVMVDFK